MVQHTPLTSLFKDSAVRSVNSAATLQQPPTRANLPRHRHREKLVPRTELCPAVAQSRQPVPRYLSRSGRGAQAPSLSWRVQRRQLCRRERRGRSGAGPGRAAHLLLTAPGASRDCLRFPWLRLFPSAASPLPRQHCGGALPSHAKPPLRCLTADMPRYRPAFHLPRAAAGAAAASLSKWQLCRRDYSLRCPLLLRPPTGFFCLLPGTAQHNMSHCFP